LELDELKGVPNETGTHADGSMEVMGGESKNCHSVHTNNNTWVGLAPGFLCILSLSLEAPVCRLLFCLFLLLLLRSVLSAAQGS